jgi:hypothetical protein
MPRVMTTGFEWQSIITAINLNPPDGYSAGSVATTVETTTVRTGAAALRCATTAAGQTCYQKVPIPSIGSNSSSTTFTVVAHYDGLSANPTTVTPILEFAGTGVGRMAAVRLTPSGTLQLWSAASTPAQVGSDSPAVSLNTPFAVSLKMNQGTVEALLDGVAFASGASGTVGVLTSEVWVGLITAPGNAVTLIVDDLLVNSNVAGWGTAEQDYPDWRSKVALLLPARPVAKGAFTTDTGSTTDADFVAAVSSRPPIGTTDSAAAGSVHQLRSASSSATEAVEFELHSFGYHGVPGHCFVDTATATARNLGDVAGNTRIAQGFYLAGTVDYVEVFLRKQGTPTDSVVLELRADSAGAPSGTVLATVSVPASLLGASFAAVQFLGLLQPLTSGMKYWLTLSRSGALDATNYYQVENGGGNGYWDGGVTNWNGSAWGAVDQTAACRFRAYHSAGNARVAGITPVAATGEAIATGTKNGTVQVTYPATGTFAAGGSTYGGDLGACGAWPTNWYWWRGAGTAPVFASAADMPRVKVTKTDATTRVADLAALGLYASYL